MDTINPRNIIAAVSLAVLLAGCATPGHGPNPFAQGSLYPPPRLMGDATSPSNSWMAVSTGLATYRDVSGSGWASYAQLATWQPYPWASVGVGALVPLSYPDRVAPEFSAMYHHAVWGRVSVEAGGYASIGRNYSLPPNCFGAMGGLRLDVSP